MRQATLLAAMLAVLAAGAAQAERSGEARHERMNFEALDTDGNGEISREEMQAQMESRFTGADTDGDGVLSRDELVAAGQKRVEDRVQRMLDRFDEDGDGSLSADEMPRPDERRAARMFDMIDSDDSGGISKEEFAEMRERMEERHTRGGGFGHKRGQKN